MKRTLGSVWNFIRRNRNVLFIFLPLFLIFVINSFHEEYPDEFDSIVGGKYILEGKVPYRDWFQHHQPGAYVVASLLLIFSGTSFVKFRVLLGIFYFALNVAGYILLKKRINTDSLSFYPFLLYMIAIIATYYWGHMLLADTLAAQLFLPAFVLIMVKGLYTEPFGKKDLITFSAFAFLTWFTSMTYTYVLAGLYLCALYLYIKTEKKTKSWLSTLGYGGAILGVPFIIFFLFFLLTGSIKDYYFANVTYNQNYYIFNYPRPPGAPVNPVRYAVIIANDFFNNFYPLLAGVKDFNFSDPFRITLAVSQAGFFVFILLRKKYILLIPFFATLIYSNSRSSPLGSGEKDYWSSVYILSSMFLGVLLLTSLKNFIDETKKTTEHIIAGFLLILIGVFWFFFSFHMTVKFMQKFYSKYMGDAPLIYDRPEVAPMLNAVTSASDYVWVGPFEFEELFYLTRAVPSKYHWFLDHAKLEPRIKDVMVSEFEQKKPVLIVFKRTYAPWGGDASTYNYFFTDFLDKYYLRVSEFSSTETTGGYRWKTPKIEHFDLETDVNILRERSDEMIQKLLTFGYIEKIESSDDERIATQ